MAMISPYSEAIRIADVCQVASYRRLGYDACHTGEWKALGNAT
jgi:hypothetical protein